VILGVQPTGVVGLKDRQQAEKLFIEYRYRGIAFCYDELSSLPSDSIVLPKAVSIRFARLFFLLSLMLGGVFLVRPTAIGSGAANAAEQSEPTVQQPLTLRADVQQANSLTGVVTARGNVQMNYPARQIQATSAQAQYFSRERRIVLSGNVYVLQKGNSLQADSVTYLIDEDRFVALPVEDQQVESIILIPEKPATDESESSSTVQ
jgi:lipopolysaccharide export system protein LptA